MRATLDILRPSVYLTLPKTVNRSTIKQGNRDILRWYIKKMDRTLETNHCMRLGYKQGSWGSASVCVCVCVAGWQKRQDGQDVLQVPKPGVNGEQTHQKLYQATWHGIPDPYPS